MTDNCLRSLTSRPIESFQDLRHGGGLQVPGPHVFQNVPIAAVGVHQTNFAKTMLTVTRNIVGTRRGVAGAKGWRPGGAVRGSRDVQAEMRQKKNEHIFFFEGLYIQENLIWKTSILKTRTIQKLKTANIVVWWLKLSRSRPSMGHLRCRLN